MTFESLVARLIQFLEVENTDRSAKSLKEVINWCGVYAKNLPPEYNDRLRDVICAHFSITPTQLTNALIGDPAAAKPSAYREDTFDTVVPPAGWLCDYIDLTKRSEAPGAFHFYAGAVAISICAGRRSWIDQGVYKLFPNLAVLLVAPTGRCRKTASINIVVNNFLSQLPINILADKTTPEALVEGLRVAAADGMRSEGLIYAPEFAVFLGRQRYNEGLVQLLTAWFDCPSVWRGSTIGRGNSLLREVYLCMVGASTADWLISAIPADAWGGGFMSRILLVPQENTNRREPHPPPLNEATIERLRDHLRAIITCPHRGAVSMSPAVLAWYQDWYNSHRDRDPLDAKFSGYWERKPDHLLRMSLLMHYSKHAEPGLDIGDIEDALRVLNWTEWFLPATFAEVSSTELGRAQLRILKQLARTGGSRDHSTLLRRNAFEVSARQFREIMSGLIEAGLVKREQNALGIIYTLTEAGHDRLGKHEA